MRSENIFLLEVDVIGCCIDDAMFYSALLLAFVYEMMILMSEHTHNRHIRGE